MQTFPFIVNTRATSLTETYPQLTSGGHVISLTLNSVNYNLTVKYLTAVGRLVFDLVDSNTGEDVLTNHPIVEDVDLLFLEEFSDYTLIYNLALNRFELT